jgi:pimeloyl-ACP methyl ester carboxylesterase
MDRTPQPRSASMAASAAHPGDRADGTTSGEIRRELVQANGLHFEVLTCGEGDTLALCLHGFPEIALSWGEQMPALAAMGYRVWAPNQRGYGRSSRPGRVRDYAIEQLMADVAGLIDASGRGVTRA